MTSSEKQQSRSLVSLRDCADKIGVIDLPFDKASAATALASVLLSFPDKFSQLKPLLKENRERANAWNEFARRAQRQSEYVDLMKFYADVIRALDVFTIVELQKHPSSFTLKTPEISSELQENTSRDFPAKMTIRGEEFEVTYPHRAEPYFFIGAERIAEFSDDDIPSIGPEESRVKPKIKTEAAQKDKDRRK